tara:strand:- start:348 stop:632 length:285 start_codon:yes stop_codon:yes gene_type:complete
MVFSQTKVAKLVDNWLDAQKGHKNPNADLTDGAIGYVNRVEKRRTRNEIAAASKRKNRPQKKSVKSRRVPGRKTRVSPTVRAKRRRALLRKRAG